MEKAPNDDLILVVAVAKTVSKFPVKLDVPDPQFGHLRDRIGETVALGIQAHKLKTDKADNGSFINYYWTVISIGPAVEETSPAPQPNGNGHAIEPRDPVGQSIERQVALKEARQAVADFMALDTEGGACREENYLGFVNRFYDHFVGLLQGTPAVAPRVAGAVPDGFVPPLPSDDSNAVVERAIPQNAGELLTWCKDDYKLSRGDVLGILRVTVLEGMKLDVAWETVKAWMVQDGH